ncbi:MAG: hypothetical protein AAFP77_23730 [Bacteroidota bacterium]
MTQEQIKALFKANKWKQVIHFLEQSATTRSQRRDISMFQSMYDRLRRQEAQGTLTAEQVEAQTNRLGIILIYLIEQAFGEKSAIPEELSEARQNRRNRQFAWLGSAAVLAVLLIFINKSFFPEVDTSFATTFYVYEGSKTQCPDLAPGSKLIIHLEDDAKDIALDEFCKITINGIPSKFRAESIPVGIALQVEGYELVKQDTTYLLDQDAQYIAIQRDGSLGWVYGKVIEKDTAIGLAGVQVEIRLGPESKILETDSLGNFRTYIPTELQRDSYPLVFNRNGTIKSYSYIPNPYDLEGAIVGF